MFDLANNIRCRLKRAKNIHNVVKRLEKEGFTIIEREINKQCMYKCYEIRKNNIDVSIYYEENEDADAEYKQNIYAIYY